MQVQDTSENDTATDQFGNQYQLVIDKGSIVSVKPLNINITPLLPKLQLIVILEVVLKLDQF